MIRIYPFQTQEVRDLAWACFSPPLLHIDQVAGDASPVAACALQLTPARQQWLEGLDRDATELLAHLRLRPTHRLGVYFEQLWHFFLGKDPDIELIAHNLPIHDEGRTLGEFDCVYYCHKRRLEVHLELAVKFFLGAPRNGTNANIRTGALRDWLGPDTRDRLDLKLSHLLEHQILLSERAEAKKRLLALGIDRVEKEIAFKGYLFQPEHNVLPTPPGYNNDCDMGRWVSCTSLLPYLAGMDTKTFMVIPKMLWLGDVRCEIPGKMLTGQDLLDQMNRHFERDHYPRLIAALDEAGLESGRFFVTPPNWPNHTNESPQQSRTPGT